MFGYDKFRKWFDGLEEKEKRKILGEMFGVEEISVYSIEKKGEKITFRLYARGEFYQYVFLFDSNLEKSYVKVNKDARIVIYQIYIGKDLKNKFDITENYTYLF